MRKIRVAQIGTNFYSHGPFVWDTMKALTDTYELVGYALPERERERLPQQVKHLDGYPEFSVEELLNDPTIDAIIVETDEIYLTKYALMAAKAGKHIHMEKPGSPNLPEFEELIATVKKNNLVFHTGYMYRYNPCVVELLKQIKAGELGEIFSVEAQMNCTHPKEVREWLHELPSGMLFFLGCHLIDMIYSIQGKPEEIIPLSCSTGLEGVTSKDFGMVVMKYPHGVSMAKTTDAQVGGFARRSLVVTGSKKTVEICPLEMFGEGELQFATMTTYAKENWDDRGQTTESEQFGRYDAMMEGFASFVRGEKENPYTCDYELELYKILLQCCEV
ncbi:MAG: Gfo/Idh/MocA family oxidoreductase [Lachnospiraceae bacterium]|nr:Gfo/Idh/MocA family oxidoreductase [Lachnospiraceae bacterium]